jgi:DNA-binding transcriptional LysR family regulator
VVCAAPDYLRRAGRPRTPQDLRTHDCLVDPFSGPNSWPFRNAARPLLVDVKGPLAASSTAVQVAMALAGCGIVRVPHHAVRAEIAGKRLELLFRQATLSPERMGAYVAKAKRLPAKTADFIEFLSAALPV